MYLSKQFIQNKYTKWYHNIILKAKIRILPTEIYNEKHHIIPRSLGGNDNESNIISLTAKEHFICHLLLTKMTSGQQKHKMLKALWCMSWGNKWHKRYRIPSKTYESIRHKFAIEMSLRLKGKSYEEIYGIDKATEIREQLSKNNSGVNNPMYNKKHTKKSKQAMSIKRKGKNTGKDNPMYGVDRSGEKNPFFGQRHTEETKQHLSKIRKGKPNYKLRGRLLSTEHRRKISENRKDRITYKWYHSKYGYEKCIRTELIKKYPELNIKSSELSMVINGRYKHHRGWSLSS